MAPSLESAFDITYLVIIELYPRFFVDDSWISQNDEKCRYYIWYACSHETKRLEMK